MVQVFFSLRFQSQLRRTRPKLLRTLERTIVDAIEGYGGKVRIEHKLISASFDSNTIGFWLDILCVVEIIKNALERASSELYGHICIIGRDIPEEDVPVITRALPSDLWGTGIWCAPGICDALASFIHFDEALTGDGENLIAGYAQIRVIREFGVSAEERRREADNSEKVRHYLKQGSSRNTVIVGEENIGKREGLYQHCKDKMDGFAPLVIRFHQYGQNTISGFVDALSPEIKKVLERSEALAELENTGEVLSRERLRDELSDFIVKRSEKYFSLLLDAYRSAAEKYGVRPALILENIQYADPMVRLIIMGIYFSRPSKERIHIYGTCTNLKALDPWEELFPRIIKFTPEKSKEISMPELPRDLWEMAYCCALFSRYFPSFLLSRLFQEEGKNPAMIEKSLDLLSRLQINNNSLMDQAAEILGERAEAVRRVVRDRLLAWVGEFRLKSCFTLISALSDLGGGANENLILDAICGDILNGTYRGIEKAIEDGSFASIVGEEREKALLVIVKTQIALTHGSREEIKEAFKDPFPGAKLSNYPGFRARMYVNSATHYLGIGDNLLAADSVKKAMLLTQNENSGRGLAHIYRLFSLVEFAGHHLSDAIDYFTFAVENAEKSEDYAELGISAYYAASAHFIFGNISKARRLAAQAREAVFKAVLPGWVDRSRFLEGRLCFETGRYQDALDIFKDLEAHYLGTGTEEFKQTLAAWIYRANIYLHNAGVSHSGGLDAQLFEMEGAFLTGEYRKALELIKELEKTDLSERFIFIEQPDWRSGFCQCELLLFSLEDLWDRMIHTYRALAVCHMSGGEACNREETIQEMQRIMREDLPETDPSDAFYFYAYYRILKRTGAPEVDLNTAISIAFKRLQRRASRIDDSETKRFFMSFHYWNSSLTMAAKEHKLI
jgi:tetratricopeptide (TPR) repeat protein